MGIFRKPSGSVAEKRGKFSFSDVTAASASSTVSNGASSGGSVRTPARKRAMGAIRRWRLPRILSLRKLRALYTETAPEADVWEKVDFNEPGLSRANLRFGHPEPRRPHALHDREAEPVGGQRMQMKKVDSELSFSTAASLAPFFGNFSGASEERRRARERAQYLVTAEAYVFAEENE